MLSNIPLVFYIPKQNRYSFNALFGAAEDLLSHFRIFVARDASDLERIVFQEMDGYGVLFLSFCTTQIFEMESLLRQIKDKRSSIKIVAGGPHPSGASEEVLGMGVDYVVIGEGEIVFRQILQRIIKEDSLSSLSGSRILRPDGLVDLDSFPPMSFRYGMIGPVEVTRGCPYGCIYCQTPRLFPGPVRHRSIETITKTVNEMLSRGIKDIRFISPNSLAYGSPNGRVPVLEAVETLLSSLRRLIGKEGRIFFGTFPSEVRPEHLDSQAVKLIKKYCNNDNIVMGAQSGSERILKLLRRGHTVEDVVRAVKVCVLEGLIPNVDFIFGIPGETEDDQLKTLAFMQRLVDSGARIHAHYFMPLPGTPLDKAMPSPLSDNLLKGIHNLIPSGKLFGQWQKQKEFTEKLLQRRYNYVRKRAS